MLTQQPNVGWGRGRAAPAQYAWASALASDAWTELPNTAFRPWANANIPAGAYQGTNPLDSIVNAYCDPSYDRVNKCQYFFGGGHGDGTCNAVIKLDHETLQYSLVGQPTPPSKYPPSYYNGGSSQPGPLTYPSGLQGNAWFLSATELTATEDLPYAAPQVARAASHMYGAALARGPETHYFYGQYARFDAASSTWSGRTVDIGAQLPAFRPQYGSVFLQQGTTGHYDDVTDRFYVTLCPGDAGGGWRSGVLVITPAGVIESVYETATSTYGLIRESVNVCAVGRRLFIFTKVTESGGTYASPQNMNQGCWFDMDTKTYQKFVLTGDLEPGTYQPTTNQETIPSFYDGTAIRRWNYGVTHRDKIMSVDPTPESGTGTPSDPYVLRQTVRTISGAPDATFVYNRLVWVPDAQCALVIPRATQNLRALKLA